MGQKVCNQCLNVNHTFVTLDATLDKSGSSKQKKHKHKLSEQSQKDQKTQNKYVQEQCINNHLQENSSTDVDYDNVSVRSFQSSYTEPLQVQKESQEICQFIFNFHNTYVESKEQKEQSIQNEPQEEFSLWENGQEQVKLKREEVKQGIFQEGFQKQNVSLKNLEFDIIYSNGFNQLSQILESEKEQETEESEKCNYQLELNTSISNVSFAVPQRQNSLRKFVKQNSLSSFTYKDSEEDNQLKELQGCQLIAKEKSEAQIQFLQKHIKELFRFGEFQTFEDKMQLIDQLELYQVKAKQTIYKQESEAQNAYILETGKLQVYLDGVKSYFITQGQIFGEIALMLNSVRECTIIAAQDSTLWALNKDKFRNTIKQISLRNFTENMQLIENIPMLKNLSQYQKSQIVASLLSMNYSKNDIIVSEGDPGDRMYIIKRGTASVQFRHQEKYQLLQGQFFGELSLLYNTPRTADVIAVSEELYCVCLLRESLNQILGSDLQMIINTNILKIGFQRNKILSKLSESQQTEIIKNMNIMKFEPNQVIIKKGSICNTLYVLIQGNIIKKQNGEKIIPYCIGEKYLLEENSKQTWQDDFVAQTQVDLAIISHKKIRKILKENFDQIIVQNELSSQLSNIDILKYLNPQQINDILENLKQTKFMKGEIIVKQGEANETFYIIKQGNVKILKDGEYLYDISKNDFFGEKSLLFQIPSAMTIIASSDEVIC